TMIQEIKIEGGYRQISRPLSASSVVSVVSKEIENRPNPNFLTTLQGQVAGANISAFSGQPGTNKIDVIIRGQGSLSASTDPLYVIDGVPLNQAFFRNLNPNEIESVSILKDAAATAIYGNRGSNGVIVITTKKGRFDESFSVNYSSSFGFTNFRGDNLNLPSSYEHLLLQKKGFDEGVGALAGSLAITGTAFPTNNLADYPTGFAINLDPNNLEAYDVNTDWEDVFFRTGVHSSHDMSFTSGSRNLRNYTSLGYFD